MTATEHFVPLGGTGWVLWREAALRGTGFAAERFSDLCDGELAAAADQLDDRVPATREQYAKVYAAATERLTAAIRRTASDPTFREAVAWQNPALVRDCLDKAAAGEPRNSRGRNHELTIASYLQRYCLKNDTIGFFGPIGWARIGPEDTGITVRPGPDLLARRTTYFEGWAIDALGAAIAARPEVWPWLRPRIAPSAILTGSTLRLPFQKPVTLSPADVRVLRRCDGRRTVRDIVGNPPDPATVAALLRLRGCGAVLIGLPVPLTTWPERELAERIAEIADPTVRDRAQAPLDELIRARDAVSAAAGDPDRLVRANAALADTFQRITGNAATRHAGQAYAARTLVYEDTVRAADIHVGRQATDALAAPLGLVLDSAVWLVNTVADRFEAAARQVLDRELERTGRRQMPLPVLLTAVMPEIGQLGATGAGSAIIAEVVTELQRRWRSVLDLPANPPAGVRRHRVTAAAIAERVAEQFATGPPRFSAARWCSPDVMVATADPAAREPQFVLGELHCASNTLESRIFAAQHPEPDRLRAAAGATGLDRRVVFIPRLDASLLTTRLSRASEMMLSSYTYLCAGLESMTAPPGATVLSVLDLVAERRGDDVVIRSRTGGPEFTFAEVAGDPLSALLTNAFQPFGGAGHRPRITIDHLVVGREAWAFAAAELSWAFVADERERYARARRWRAEHALPEHGFVRVPVERKPVAVDFRSLPLVNLLGKAIRRTVEAGGGEVTLTEMLPDFDRLWLRDARGARYTAEFRMVAVRAG